MSKWSVLDWNTPAIDFYRSIGAISIVQRLTGDTLKKLAVIELGVHQL